CANSPRETSLGRASIILLAGIGVAIMVRSKLPWRRKCMPLYYMDPTIEGISLSWSSIENRACLIFLAVAFANVAAKPGNLLKAPSNPAPAAGVSLWDLPEIEQISSQT